MVPSDRPLSDYQVCPSQQSTALPRPPGSGPPRRLPRPGQACGSPSKPEGEASRAGAPTLIPKQGCWAWALPDHSFVYALGPVLDSELQTRAERGCRCLRLHGCVWWSQTGGKRQQTDGDSSGSATLEQVTLSFLMNQTRGTL